MRPFSWTNQATQELACWLIEDVVGAEFVNGLRGTDLEPDTPTRTLGQTIQEAFVELMPLPADPNWIAEINWDEIAQYLIQTVRTTNG